MNSRMRLLVKRIQYWLKKHEYQSGYSGLKLHACYDKYGCCTALCRYGVVETCGGGAVVEKWTSYSVSDLNELFKRAKKQYNIRSKNEQNR